MQQRVESYRARQAPAGQVQADAAAAARVVAFRPSIARRYRSMAMAQPVADPVADSMPDAVPPPALGLVEAWAAPAAVTPSVPIIPIMPVVAAMPARLPLEPELESESTALLQIPLPLAQPGPSTMAPPLAVAPRPVRLRAAAWDAAMVVLASLLFAGAAWAEMGFPLEAVALRPWLPAMVAVPGVLAALYLAASFSTGTATWGMRHCGLRLECWEGELTPAACQRRAWSCVFSLAALGLGFAWMLCDSQQLTWHDYISRTFIAGGD
ncbi:MAG TPA: RDD family protein [Terriglobales bacterium]